MKVSTLMLLFFVCFLAGCSTFVQNGYKQSRSYKLKSTFKTHHPKFSPISSSKSIELLSDTSIQPRSETNLGQTKDTFILQETYIHAPTIKGSKKAISFIPIALPQSKRDTEPLKVQPKLAMLSVIAMALSGIAALLNIPGLVAFLLLAAIAAAVLQRSNYKLNPKKYKNVWLIKTAYIMAVVMAITAILMFIFGAIFGLALAF